MQEFAEDSRWHGEGGCFVGGGLGHDYRKAKDRHIAESIILPIVSRFLYRELRLIESSCPLICRFKRPFGADSVRAHKERKGSRFERVRPKGAKRAP